MNKTQSVKTKDIDLLAVNGICIDWLLKMPKLPSYDEKLSAEYLGKFAGGPVGNFACLASSFGARVAAACTLGADEGGKIIHQDFAQFGVETTYVVHDAAFTTPFVIVMVDPTGEKAVILPRLEENDSAGINPQALARSKYVYMLAADYKNTLKAAKQAHLFDTKVVLDIEPSETLTSDRLTKLLSYCDIASFNEQGFTACYGQPFAVEKARHVLSLGPSVIVITRGKLGSLAVSKNETVGLPGYSVDVKDTTGAGDTFNAAFMSRFIQGVKLEGCLRFGNAAAALLIQTVGTRTHIPTLNEIDQFIKSQKKRMEMHDE